MNDLAASHSEPPGWIQFDKGPWERATFALAPRAFVIRASSGATSWISLAEIRRVEETGLGQEGWPQVEIVLADSRTIGAVLTVSNLDELLAAISAAVGSDPQPDAWSSGPETSNRRTDASTPVGDKRQKQLPLMLGGALLAIVLAVATIATGVWAMNRSGSQTIRGVYTLFSADSIAGPVDDCEGTGGYSDFSSGADVKVRDAEGRIVGSGTMTNVSNREDFYERVLEIDKSFDSIEEVRETFEKAHGMICPLTFEVRVPDLEVYELEIFGKNRGTQTYTRDELEANNWLVSIMLGT